MKQQIKNILDDWDRNTINHLCHGLQRLLDHVGDVLVDFASKSESNAIQTEFFDAQRELFLKGAATVPAFQKQLESYTQTAAPARPEPGADTLSLLDKDDYDLSVALDTIADNCAQRNQQSLHALSQRMSAIHGGRHVTPEKLTLNPHQVTQALQQCSEPLALNKRVQLVLYTLFDRYVVSLLDEAYETLNQQLAEAGVLPTVRYRVSKKPGSASGGPAGPSPSEDQSAEQQADTPHSGFNESESIMMPADTIYPPSTDESIQAIRALLTEQRRAKGMAPQLPPTPQEQQASVQHLNQALNSPALTEHAVSNAASVLSIRSDKMMVDKQLLFKVKEALSKQRSMIQSLTDRSKLTEQDQDLIEIVGLLFEAILDDENLPVVVKTLLAHLHTPYLKIAANDPVFLQGTEHPARLLLDYMLQLGAHWVDTENLNQGIFPDLQRTVRQILDKPLEIDFGELQEALVEREKQLKQNRQLTEKRTLATEQGQATLAQSRKTAQSAVKTLLSDRPLPKNVRTFLQTMFVDYLSLLLLRNGMNPKHPKCKEALSHTVQMIKRVSSGDNEAAVSAAQPLGELIVELLPHYESPVEDFIAGLHGPLTPDTPPPEEKKEATQDTAPTSEELAAMELKPGTWLRWTPKGSDKEQPIKLIWINPHTRNLLFVDQNGAKAAQMQALEVSDGLNNGSLKPMKKILPGSLLNGLFDGIRKRLQPTQEPATK